jgi:uncharacterized damage-inducible protein DinB
MVAITGEELLAYVEYTTDKFKKLLTEHPEILSLPCDIRETQSVAQLLQHIVAVELRYPERLLELPQTDYATIPYDSVDAIYATHNRAFDLIRPLLEKDEDWWEEVLEFKTRSIGALHITRRTALVQSLTHSIRHYAQLATLVRHHGITADLPLDYIFMGLLPSIS